MRFRVVISLFIVICSVPGMIFSNVSEESPGKAENLTEVICDDARWETIKKSQNMDVLDTFIGDCADSRWLPLAQYLKLTLREEQERHVTEEMFLNTQHDTDW